MTREDHLLSPTVTAHCFFFGRGCKHTVTDTPVATHDVMEQHYRDRHTLLIDALIAGGLK